MSNVPTRFLRKAEHKKDDDLEGGVIKDKILVGGGDSQSIFYIAGIAFFITTMVMVISIVSEGNGHEHVGHRQHTVHTEHALPPGSPSHHKYHSGMSKLQPSDSYQSRTIPVHQQDQVSGRTVYLPGQDMERVQGSELWGRSGVGTQEMLDAEEFGGEFEETRSNHLDVPLQDMTAAEYSDYIERMTRREQLPKFKGDTEEVLSEPYEYRNNGNYAHLSKNAHDELAEDEMVPDANMGFDESSMAQMVGEKGDAGTQIWSTFGHEADAILSMGYKLVKPKTSSASHLPTSDTHASTSSSSYKSSSSSQTSKSSAKTTSFQSKRISSHSNPASKSTALQLYQPQSNQDMLKQQMSSYQHDTDAQQPSHAPLHPPLAFSHQPHTAPHVLSKSDTQQIYNPQDEVVKAINHLHSVGHVLPQHVKASAIKHATAQHHTQSPPSHPVGEWD